MKIVWNKKVCANCHGAVKRGENLFCRLKVDEQGIPNKRVKETHKCRYFVQK